MTQLVTDTKELAEGEREREREREKSKTGEKGNLDIILLTNIYLV